LLEFWKSKYDKALSGERVVFEISNQVGKELRYYEVSLNPIILNGKATGVSGISSDITEKKETHRILLQSRANILAILENTTDSIWAINSSYEILFANDVFVSAFHTTFGVRLGPGVNLLLSLPKPMRQLWKSHYDRVLSNEMFSFIDKIEVENGTIHIEVHLNPIVVDDKVIGASFFGKDITRRIKSEEALKESETQLRELNVTKDKLFSIIAHDLRSPFNSILGFSELLIENAKNSDIVESEMHSRIINSSAKNTLILLDNLLDWAKSQTGQISFKPEKINLLSIIQEIIESSNLMAKIKNISLNLIQSEEIEAYADANMVKTVLRNLISNAIKFTNPGGNINVNGISEQNQVEISISDNGIGMNDETRKKLFDISSNITFLGTTKEKGSGLGLVLCKEFVERLGGHIWVESEEGKGSDFRFSLPLNKT
jgi:signal transduction histidine kinase